MFLCLVQAAVNCLFTYPPAGNGYNLKVQLSATLKDAGLPLNTSILHQWNFTGNTLAPLRVSVMGGTGIIVFLWLFLLNSYCQVHNHNDDPQTEIKKVKIRHPRNSTSG